MAEQKTKLEILLTEENWYVESIKDYESEIEIYKKELIAVKKKIKAAIEK